MEDINVEYIQRFHDRHIEACSVCNSSTGIICPNGEALLRLEEKKVKAGIPIEYRKLTLEHMVETKLKGVLGEVWEYIKNYESNLERGIGLFLFSKDTGTGKTAIAYGIAMEFLKRDKTAYCIGFDQCIDLLSSYALNAESQRQFRQKLLSVDLLILDDLGLKISLTEKQKEFVQNQFTLLFRERSSNLKPVILTSNKLVDDLEKLYGQQFKSVFMSRTKSIEFPEGDYRALELNVGGYET